MIATLMPVIIRLWQAVIVGCLQPALLCLWRALAPGPSAYELERAELRKSAEIAWMEQEIQRLRLENEYVGRQAAA